MKELCEEMNRRENDPTLVGIFMSGAEQNGLHPDGGEAALRIMNPNTPERFHTTWRLKKKKKSPDCPGPSSTVRGLIGNRWHKMSSLLSITKTIINHYYSDANRRLNDEANKECVALLKNVLKYTQSCQSWHEVSLRSVAGLLASSCREKLYFCVNKKYLSNEEFNLSVSCIRVDVNRCSKQILKGTTVFRFSAQYRQKKHLITLVSSCRVSTNYVRAAKSGSE